ncbi:MBL fold metallo-hydrolase [Halalkalibacter hemicellulosilyticus]|nr:MBL fold metallo-hydrolase [Halalkalibacter hemicellulosilyticus]
MRDIMKWQAERWLKRKDLSYKVPHTKKTKIHEIYSNREFGTITWIGHVTFLIQLSGLNIVTDPVWASRVGFEKRLSKPGIMLEDMPEIDIVLISHNHYDHLHFNSIYQLKGDPLFLVPKGLKRLFLQKGITNVKEFNWWDCMLHKQLELTFLPTLHWSRRSLLDLNKSLWGGWMVKERSKTIFFVGDSGYHPIFKKIGRSYQIDYALIPIGAYEPEWFMKQQHVTPEEAVQCFQELNASTFIPMHYDAFRLADDTPKEALDRLKKAWNKRKGSKKLMILKLGETLDL